MVCTLKVGKEGIASSLAEPHLFQDVGDSFFLQQFLSSTFF